MSKLSRRAWLGLAAVAPCSGIVVALGTAARRRRTECRSAYFPNVVLQTHDGRSVRFYDDLLKDKIVLINFMYTVCRGSCPTVTRNLLRVQKLLGGRVGRDIFMYSISIKPQEDTPERLKEYAEGNEVGPG